MITVEEVNKKVEKRGLHFTAQMDKSDCILSYLFKLDEVLTSIENRVVRLERRAKFR